MFVETRFWTYPDHQIEEIKRPGVDSIFFITSNGSHCITIRPKNQSETMKIRLKFSLGMGMHSVEEWEPELKKRVEVV